MIVKIISPDLKAEPVGNFESGQTFQQKGQIFLVVEPCAVFGRTDSVLAVDIDTGEPIFFCRSATVTRAIVRADVEVTGRG